MEVYYEMDEHIYKQHNKTLLLYHLVFPAKYRREVFTAERDVITKYIAGQGKAKPEYKKLYDGQLRFDF